jgi:transposase InsO family protein
MDKKDQQWSLFWCGILHSVIFGQVEEGQTYQKLKEISQTEILFPNGVRKKPSLSTLKRKLKLYKKESFEGLFRKKRSDQGKIRSVKQQIMDKAIELKKDQPYRSEQIINQFLEQEYGKTIPKSTLYRHLHKAGATRIKLGISSEKVRKRWSCDHTHDLWVGDFEEGPYVLDQGQVVPTYLSLFIDCHSRYVVEGRYYLRQSLDILIDSLLKAWAIHGKSLALYVDNAKVYHANALKAACYKLNINLLHRIAGDPQGGGLVERIFQTCQSQFEKEVKAGDILTLNQLNQAFCAWLCVSYHQSIHSEIEQTPNARYHQGLTHLRKVDLQEISRYFMTQEIRVVNRVFSDVQLHNLYFRVDPKLRSDKVKVYFDPYSDQQQVLIYSLDEQYLGTGKRYVREYSEKDQQIAKSHKPKHSYLDLIQNQHQLKMQQMASGIDFRKVVEPKRWPFTAFAQKMASLMGKPDGISAFNTLELEALKKAYNTLIHLNEPMLTQAFEQATVKSIPYIILQLQFLNNRKNPNHTGDL